MNIIARQGKKGINRINNNLMFHPHKTDIQGTILEAGLDKRPYGGFLY